MKQSKKDILSHVRRNHTENKIEYKCKVSEFKTHYKASLRNHTKDVHIGQIVLCNICKSTFRRKDTLEIHIRAVHEGKTFNCTCVTQHFQNELI